MKRNSTEEIDLDELFASLFENNFNISKACEQIGVSRQAYYYHLMNNEKFANKVSLGNAVLKNIATNGLLEGLVNEDLKLRIKYIDTLAKAGILSKLLGFEDNIDEVTFKLHKEDFVGK